MHFGGTPAGFEWAEGVFEVSGRKTKFANAAQFGGKRKISLTKANSAVDGFFVCANWWRWFCKLIDFSSVYLFTNKMRNIRCCL